MSSISPYAYGGPAHYTSLGPTNTPGGFSGNSFGTPGLPNGFGFPSYGDPLFYFMPAASSFFINRLLGFANGSAVNINVGPTPSHLGMGDLLLGLPFYRDEGTPNLPGQTLPLNYTDPAANYGQGGPGNGNNPLYQQVSNFGFQGSGNPMFYNGQNPDAWYGGQGGLQGGVVSPPLGANNNGSGNTSQGALPPWGLNHNGLGNSPGIAFNGLTWPSSGSGNAGHSGGTQGGASNHGNNNNSLLGAMMGWMLGHSNKPSLLDAPSGGGSGTPIGTVGTNVTGGSGSVWGDPHFVDLEHKATPGKHWGANYDVMGEGGKTYVLLSDQSIQLNGEFKEAHRSGDNVVTVVGKVGLKLTDDNGQEVQLMLDADGEAPKLGDTALKAGDSFKYTLNGKEATISYDNQKLRVDTNEYGFEFDKGHWQYGNYLNYHATVKSEVMADAVNPHGLLGQTADFDGVERLGKRGAGAQGEGAIDLKHTDYEVANLFADSTNTVIDRYGTQTHGDNAMTIEGKTVYSTLKNENNDLLMAVNRDAEGRVILNEQGEAAMVGVRRTKDDAGTTTLFLADGKTQINTDGKVIDKDGVVKAGNNETVKPAPKAETPPAVKNSEEKKSDEKKPEPAPAVKPA